MKKIKKTVAVLLTVLMSLTILPMPVQAAESYGYEVVASPSPVAIGSEVELLFRLTDYTEAKSGIRGFQIDMTDVDDALNGAVCTALVTDTDNVLSNTAKYQTTRDLVRYLFVKTSGTMSYTNDELMTVRFRIPEHYTEAGTLEFPLRILIQNEAGDKLTYTDTVRVPYAPEGEIPDQPETPEGDAVSVDVTWGEMEYEYSRGTWNPVSHVYEDPCWLDNGTGYVTVTNRGSADTAVSFVYASERTDISGSFDTGSSVALPSGEEVTAHLLLEGTPSDYMAASTVIGTVTVTIGGE